MIPWRWNSDPGCSAEQEESLTQNQLRSPGKGRYLCLLNVAGVVPLLQGGPTEPAQKRNLVSSSFYYHDCFYYYQKKIA